VYPANSGPVGMRQARTERSRHCSGRPMSRPFQVEGDRKPWEGIRYWDCCCTGLAVLHRLASKSRTDSCAAGRGRLTGSGGVVSWIIMPWLLAALLTKGPGLCVTSIPGFIETLHRRLFGARHLHSCTDRSASAGVGHRHRGRAQMPAPVRRLTSEVRL
jgi:hypothetical protein